MPKETDKFNYLPALVAAAPAFGAKAVIGDLPKGAIEHAVEGRVAKKTSLLKGLKQGLKGRGSGRAMGAGIGILTAPVFLRGIQLAQSPNKEERAKGLALIGGSASVYTAQKGVLEGFKASRVSGKSRAKSLLTGAGLGAMRTTYKLPAALALGAALAQGQKKKKESDKYLTSALGGTAVGALSRGGEKAVPLMVKNRKKGMSFSKAVTKALRASGTAALGGAAGGALGGLVLSGVISSAKKSMKKEKKAAPMWAMGAPAKAALHEVATDVAPFLATVGTETLTGVPVSAIGALAGASWGAARNSKKLKSILGKRSADTAREVAEEVIDREARLATKMKQNRKQKLLAAGAGGVAAGSLLGAGLASRTKTASLTAELGMNALHAMKEGVVGLPLIHQGTRGAFRAGTASRAMDFIPGAKGVKSWMDKARARQLGLGIREGLAGEKQLGWRGTMALGYSVPELRLNREAGMQLGALLRGVPEAKREKVLRQIAGRVSNNPKLLYNRKGDPVPILSSMDRGVRLALGDEKMYDPRSPVLRKLTPAYKTLMYHGRGSAEGGLPKGFRPHKRVTTLGKYGPDALTALTGAGLAVSGIPIPGAAMLGVHGGIGGVKGLMKNTKTFTREAKKLSAEGFKDAFLPGLSETPKRRLKDTFLHTAISPLSRSGAELSAALTRASAGRLASMGLGKPAKKQLKKRLGGQYGSPGLGLGAPAAMGLAVGATNTQQRKRKKKKK